MIDKETYLSVVKKAWVALTDCVNEKERVGWMQPIGADTQQNFSEDSCEVFGTGAFLLAASNAIKLKQHYLAMKYRICFFKTQCFEEAYSIYDV